MSDDPIIRGKIFRVLSFAMGLSAVVASLALAMTIGQIPAYWVVAVSNTSILVFGIASLVFVLLLMARAWFED